MFKRCWIIAFVFGLGLAGLGEAQQASESPQGEAETEQPPPQTFPIPFPVEIIEDDSKADTRQRNEDEARQREIDDLVAQEGMNAATQAMNEATQRMADDSRQMTVATWVGVGLLFVTLLLTLQANRAAVRAAKAVYDVDRAWMTIAGSNITTFGSVTDQDGKSLGPSLAISLRWENTGRSPATSLNLVAFNKIVDFESQTPVFEKTELGTAKSAVGPGSEIATRQQFITQDDARDIFECRKSLFIYSKIVYKTATGDDVIRFSEVVVNVRLQPESGGMWSSVLSPVGDQIASI